MYLCREEQFLNTKIDLTGAISLHFISSTVEINRRISPQFLLEKKIGLGIVFSLTIRYCNWARNITQGKPNILSRSFLKKLICELQGIQTTDLIGKIGKYSMFTPTLDIFDHVLFGYLRDRLKMPSWWYHPEGKLCAFVLTFDEDWFGERANRFLNPNIPTTWFLTDDSKINTNSVMSMKAKGVSFQLHWNRLLIHLNKFGLHFCLRSIKKQIDNISHSTAIRPVACRIHYLRWDRHVDNLFFVMKEAGINLDSSFGPGRKQHGYLFATGYPYLVGDKKGRPIGIEEIPFQIHEPQGGASVEEHLRLLREAKCDYHTALVGLFHPYDCLPGKESYESYWKLLDSLHDKSAWCTNLENLSLYWNERRRRGIVSIFEGRELKIEVSDSLQRQMTLCFPDEENINSIILDERQVEVNSKLVLENGKHSLIVKYRD
jgi:hypothetical protein